MAKKYNINGLKKAHSAYETQLHETAEYISQNSELGDEVGVIWQSGDGFVVEFEGNNAPLADCISHIAKTGGMTIDEYLDLCI